jgi:hypothetical protein
MEEIIKAEAAVGYNDRTNAAARAVLLEICQVLGSYKDKFTLIGGMVPSLLLPQEEIKHAGTNDVDIVLDPEALAEGEYASLVQLLLENDYKQNFLPDQKEFQLVREIELDDGGPSIYIIVDFLMPRKAKFKRNRPSLVAGFAAQKADAPIWH